VDIAGLSPLIVLAASCSRSAPGVIVAKRPPGFPMPMPLSLSDDEYAAVQAAAAPIHPRQRGAFLKTLALSAILSSGLALCTVAPRPCRRPLSSRPSVKPRPIRDI
jgi:hypothetical protein